MFCEITAMLPMFHNPPASAIGTCYHGRQILVDRRDDVRAGGRGCNRWQWQQALSGLLLCLFVVASQAFAEDQPVGPPQIKHQITGLFMPEREQDFRDLIEKLPEFKLVSIDYPNAEVVLEYDPAKLWPNDPPEKYAELLNNQLRNASRGTFGAKPLRTIPLEKLKLIEIPVVGLDCKGCSYAAYEMIFELPGVERATASFKAGKVTALIDPALSDQGKLEEALKKGGVEIPRPADDP